MHGLNHLGPEGYHWRVCVEDKPVPGATTTEKTFSWWDVQDENASLPIKEATQSNLTKFFAPNKTESHSDSATKAAKGALKMLGKAVAGHDGVDHHGSPVKVVAFKLLDLVKMHDDFSHKNHGRGGHIQQTTPAPRAAPRPAARTPAPARGGVRASAPPRQQHQHAPAPRSTGVPARAPAPRQPAGEASLMDFGAPAGGGAAGGARSLQHTTSMPASFNNRKPNESKAEKLKREYAKKQQTSDRVWDDVDQRWVEVDKSAGPTSRGTTSAPPGAANRPPPKKNVGISLDAANAVGKSATVQAAVNQRVNEMKQSQQKALSELKAVEDAKKKKEEEEDVARKKLEPKIKAWSEEHGKKKQLRALLGSLHLILWPGAKWKAVSLGDILDNSKCKRCYHKASRVVHPDKTHHLEAEQRFLAKRIFDALSQAKTEFDNSG